MKSAESLRYRAFSLSIGSEFPLASLLESRGTPDVSIRMGDFSSEPGILEGRVKWQNLSRETGTLWVDGVAAFVVTAGKEVRIAPVRGGAREWIEPFLLGRVFPALLAQRDMFPLHASSVNVGGQAVGFIGRSGAGKSSVAAALLSRGHELVSDDITAIERSADASRVHPSYPLLKADPMVVKALGLEGMVSGPFGTGAKLALKPPQFRQNPICLGGLFVVESGSSDDHEGISPLAPSRAVHALVSNYFGLVTAGSRIQGFEGILGVASEIVDRVKVYRLTRGHQLDRLASLAAKVEEALG